MRLSLESSFRNGVVSILLYGVVDLARVDSRKIMTTLRFVVWGVGTSLVCVGKSSAASFASISGVTSSLTIMFATASLENALPAPVALGSSEREKKRSAARHAATGAIQGRLAFSAGTCQMPRMKRVMTAGPATP